FLFIIPSMRCIVYITLIFVILNVVSKDNVRVIIEVFVKVADKKRVLINAFTVRALRDTFPPARGAGIMALRATSSYYDITEVATRILPNVVVLTIDPDRLYLTMSLYSL
ncbi:N-terminal kinase-like protein, partial [Glycine soja]